jgi:DNA polymerase-3 subunit gamma/tau
MTLLRMLAFRPADLASAPPVAGGSGRPAASRNTEGSRSNTPVAARPPAKAAQRAPSKQPETATGQRSDAPAVVENPAKTALRSPAQPGGEDLEWIALARTLDLSGPVRELARNVHLQSRKDDQWEFVIAHSLKHLGSASCVSRLSQALSEQLGHRVMVRLVDSEDAQLPTAAALEEQQLNIKLSDAERAINEDPTVQALKDQFGARIVEDSIQPLQ